MSPTKVFSKLTTLPLTSPKCLNKNSLACASRLLAVVHCPGHPKGQPRPVFHVCESSPVRSVLVEGQIRKWFSRPLKGKMEEQNLHGTPHRGHCSKWVANSHLISEQNNEVINPFRDISKLTSTRHLRTWEVLHRIHRWDTLPWQQDRSPRATRS